jgi:hypothetical protein
MRSEADVPKGHERVGSMNVGLRGSTIPKKPGHDGSASGSGIPDDGAGTSSGVPTLQGAAGIGPGGRTPRQMTYVIGSQLQVPRSPSKSPPGGRRVPESGEGGYPDIPGKRLSPLIVSNDKAAQQCELQGMGSGRGPPGPSGGGGEPSSSARMRIDFERQPSSEPPIFRDGDTFFDGLTGPMVTSQGENYVMRSWRMRVFQNGVVADAFRLGLSLLVQRGKDRRLRNLLALWLAAMPLMLVSIQ